MVALRVTPFPAPSRPRMICSGTTLSVEITVPSNDRVRACYVLISRGFL
jgi:hypothetical protein